jgi:hypothetical protein
MQTTVAGVTNLSFWWKVSSVTNHGRLKFYVNNVEQFQITGEVGWQLKTNIAITSGTNTLRWTCTNDDLAVGSLNRAWVDEVTFQPPIGPPGIPSSLTAIAGDGKATLNWSAVSNATSYQVKRSATNGGPFAVIAAAVPALSYTNNGLANGTMYYYVVSANNFFGEGTDSSPASARPVSLAPTSLGSTMNGGQLQFSWASDHTGWRLVTQTNTLAVGLGTNWSTVSGSAATNQISVPMNKTNGSIFFRLVYP